MSKDEANNPATRAMASLLEAYGDRAFDIEGVDATETRVQFAALAQEILAGTPRDYKPLLETFVKHREGERRQVTIGFADLRSLVWTFAAMMARELAEEQHASTRVMAQMSALQAALSGSSTEALREQARATLSLIDVVSKSRKARQTDSMRQLGESLRVMREELDTARAALAIDALTELYNRAALDKQIQKIADLSIFSGRSAAVLMVDIDHFKKINDQHGHPAGDAVLKAFARRLIGSFPRKSEFVARYGGEEFAVVFQEDGLDVADRLAKQFLDRLRTQPIPIDDKTSLTVTASIGASELRAGEPATQWIKRADTALYEAKRAGRDRVVRA